MLIAAIAHLLAFSVKPYKLETTQSWWRNILSAANISDVHSEVTEHCKHIGSKVGSLSSSLAGSLYRVSSSQERVKQSDETTRLLDNESFNSYSYAGTFTVQNTETASNFSNAASNSKFLSDQSSLANLYPSSLISTDHFPNTSEKQLNLSVHSDTVIAWSCFKHSSLNIKMRFFVSIQSGR